MVLVLSNGPNPTLNYECFIQVYPSPNLVLVSSYTYTYTLIRIYARKWTATLAIFKTKFDKLVRKLVAANLEYSLLKEQATKQLSKNYFTPGSL